MKYVNSEFVSSFAAENGYPVWDKALLKKTDINISSLINSAVSSNLDTLVYIPIVLQSDSSINGYILANINTLNITYDLKKNYKNYPFTQSTTEMTASKFALSMMLLNKSVFGKNVYKITDPRLFSNSNLKRTKAIKILEEATTNLAEFEVECTNTWEIQDIWFDPDGDADPTDDSGNEYYLYSELSVSSMCHTFPGAETSTNLPNTSPATPGQGTSGWSDLQSDDNFSIADYLLFQTLNLNLQELNWVVQHPNEFHLLSDEIYLSNYAQQNLDFANLVISYLVLNPNINFNSFYYSQLTKVENNLTNPCLKNVVDAVGTNGHKSMLFKKYQDIQNIANFPIKFIYEQVPSLPLNAAGKTVPSYTRNILGKVKGAKMTIKLSETELIGKSKEYVSSIVLHEICHAIIIAIRESKNLPANTVFPPEHAEIITTLLFKTIYEALKEIYPTANDSDLKDLSIGGLKEVIADPTSGILLNNSLTQTIEATFPSINIFNAYNVTILAYRNLTKGTICN